MKKLVLLLFCTFFAQLAYSQGVNKYKSHNYYGNGVTEYIHIHHETDCADMGSVKIYYFTSKNPQKVLLELTQFTLDCYAFSECSTTYRVNFPKETVSYKLTQMVMHLQCESNGKVQPYEYIHD